MIIVVGSGGGGGPANGSMVIMPSNPEINFSNVTDSACTIIWDEPYHEIPIAEYKIYHSTASPSSLNDMHVLGVVPYTTRTYTATGLYPGITHYFVVVSIGSNEYENASIEHIKSIVTKSAYIIGAFGFNINATSWPDGDNYGHVPEQLVTTGPHLYSVSDNGLSGKAIPVPIKALSSGSITSTAGSMRQYNSASPQPLMTGTSKGWVGVMSVRGPNPIASDKTSSYAVSFGYWICDPYGENYELHVLNSSVDNTISGYSGYYFGALGRSPENSNKSAIVGDTEMHIIIVILYGQTSTGGYVLMIPKGKSDTKQVVVKQNLGRDPAMLYSYNPIGNQIRIGQRIYVILGYSNSTNNFEVPVYFGCIQLDNTLGATWAYEPVELFPENKGYTSPKVAFFGLVNGRMLIAISDTGSGYNKCKFCEIVNYASNPSLTTYLYNTSALPLPSGSGTFRYDGSMGATTNIVGVYGYGFTYLYYKDGYYYAYYGRQYAKAIFRSRDLQNWSYYTDRNAHSYYEGRQGTCKVGNKIICIYNGTQLNFSTDGINFVTLSSGSGGTIGITANV